MWLQFLEDFSAVKQAVWERFVLMKWLHFLGEIVGERPGFEQIEEDVVSRHHFLARQAFRASQHQRQTGGAYQPRIAAE
jgi:hypothetical protein